MDENYKPGPGEWILAGGLGVGAIFSAIFIKWWVGLLLLGLLALLLGACIGYRALSRRKRERQFSSDLQQHSTVAGTGIRSAKDKASLDELRGKFNKGMQVYKSKGKDIYSVPWYLFIGTAGSGKSMAIAHSDINFPPGLNEPMQGSGGTINMDWWFTNYGVILDTAGAMVFPEAGTDERPEWEEFLKLVRKSRPNCPINGLFLAMPVDSLIGDSAEEISAKAGRIAQQLDRIQRILDVRFPVYVLVTKSDRLVGFKEYFENLNDPQLQHQILGWSNPETLDAPFNPDAVDDYLGGLILRIKARRQAVIRDPVGMDPSQGGRLDAVDATFAFPETLVRVVPRLKRYLQVIFSAGEFSGKPVFLRGIYFTSAMQKGQDLDEEVAKILGIEVNALPEGAFYREKSYFLRDLFIEKAFKEKKLVTAATNTRKMLRNRRLFLIGFGGVALAFVGLFSVLGWRALNKAVGQEKAVWEEGAKGWAQLAQLPDCGSFWHPIVEATFARGFRFNGTNLLYPDFPEDSLVAFHVKLKDRVSQPLNVSWIFKPLVWLRPNRDVNNRKTCQRILLEQSVIVPLVENARLKMAAMQPGDSLIAKANLDRDVRLRSALETLVQIEADEDKGAQRVFIGSNGQEEVEGYLNSLYQFVMETNGKLDKDLIGVCAWTYSAEGAGKWPPAHLAVGTNLASNPAISVGLDCLISQVKANERTVQARIEFLDQTCAALGEAQKAEDDLFKEAANNCEMRDADCDAWGQARLAVDAALRKAMAEGAYKPSSNLIQGCFVQIKQSGALASQSAFDGIVNYAKKGGRPLFRELLDKCKGASGEVQQQIDGVLQKYPGTALDYWDQNLLSESGGTRLYEIRGNCYTKLFALRRYQSDIGEMVGQRWTILEKLKKDLADAARDVDGYNGPQLRGFKAVCRCAIDESGNKMTDSIMDAYLAGAQAKLQQFGLAQSISFDDLAKDQEFLGSLEKDLEPVALSKPPLRWLGRLKQLGQDIDAVKKALINAYVLGARERLAQVSLPIPSDPLGPYNHFRAMWDKLDQEELKSAVVKDFPQAAIATLRQIADVIGNRLLTEYAKSCNSKLDEDLGFPVIFKESAKLMDLDTLKGFRKQLKERRDELGKVLARDEPAELKRLRQRVERFTATISALLSDEGVWTKVIVRVASRQEAIAAACRYAWVSAGSFAPQRLDFTHLDTPDKTKPFDLDWSLKVDVTQFTDLEKGEKVNKGDDFLFFGAIDLIRKHRDDHDRRQAGRVWVVGLDVKSGENVGKVNLELEFDKPLPALSDWEDVSQ